MMAARGISEKACPNSGELPRSIVSCHGWGRFGGTVMISAAFIMLELHCSPPLANDVDVKGESEPTEEDLLSPGGASLEEIAHLTPHRADELYNEFDFTGPSTPDSVPITLSYGERVSNSAPIDFQPFVQRAERLAETYHSFLTDLGETRDTFRITHREWYLANHDFVTVHVCFGR
jgi:hypothetical protein